VIVALLVAGLAVLPTVRTNPVFRLPFPCGQRWIGATRTSHNPPWAIDFNRPGDFGDPVVASADGTVAFVDIVGTNSYGRVVVVRHRGGWETRYAHLSVIAVRRGEHVEAGDRLGSVGSTGTSTGAHLHYEQRYHGRAVRARFASRESPTQGVREYATARCPAGATSATTP
jgi:murein DD-endopeptidase MepM/ murein hydrolase activator NlpD